MNQHPMDSLSPEKMQLFVAGLSGLRPKKSARRSPSIFAMPFRNSKALQASYAGFGQAAGLFLDNPDFLADHRRRRR